MAKAKTKRRSYFARRSSRPRSRAKFSIPISIVAGFMPVAVGVWNRRNSGTEIGNYLQAGFTGIGTDGKFNIANMRQGMMPVTAGFVAHMVASKLGINRAIARAGIPLIRI